MIEIREAQGRYEVFSPGRHWEVFEGRLGAQAAALALAGEIQRETGSLPEIASPWPVYPAHQPTAATCGRQARSHGRACQDDHTG